MTADFPVVFALYPRVTQLDFTGPFEVLARLPGARCVLASVEGGRIQADGGITFAGVVPPHCLTQIVTDRNRCLTGIVTELLDGTWSGSASSGLGSNFNQRRERHERRRPR
jgi:hypothetical protein